MGNDTIAAAWLDHLKRDRGLSDNTITTYQRTLRTITFDLLNATYDDVAAWTHSRAHLAVATRNNEIAALRSFYRWALAFDHVDRDPTARTYAPKVPTTAVFWWACKCLRRTTKPSPLS